MPKSGYYQEVAKDLIRRIENGEFMPGDPLPKQVELASAYQTTVCAAVGYVGLSFDQFVF